MGEKRKKKQPGNNEDTTGKPQLRAEPTHACALQREPAHAAADVSRPPTASTHDDYEGRVGIFKPRSTAGRATNAASTRVTFGKS